MVVGVIEIEIEADIVGERTMATVGLLQGGPRRHIGVVVGVVITLLRRGPHRHIGVVVGVITRHLGAHLIMVADQGGTAQGRLLTGVLKGIMVVASLMLISEYVVTVNLEDVFYVECLCCLEW